MLEIYDPNLFDEDLEEDADEWEENMLQEYGWYMHSILAEDIDGIHANYHTHGLEITLIIKIYK